jgi:hypothetical protein
MLSESLQSNALGFKIIVANMSLKITIKIQMTSLFTVSTLVLNNKSYWLHGGMATRELE